MSSTDRIRPAAAGRNGAGVPSFTTSPSIRSPSASSVAGGGARRSDANGSRIALNRARVGRTSEYNRRHRSNGVDDDHPSRGPAPAYTVSQREEILNILCELSDCLETGLNRLSLDALWTLLECDRTLNPEALAAVVRELRSR